MTREEFITQLRLTLQGKVSSAKVQENINYYNDYIIEETRKGKSEAEVLEMLGDPGLLAKTIIAADDAGQHSQETIYDSEDGTAYSGKSERNAGGAASFGYSGGGKLHLLNLNNWWQKLLLVLVVVMAVLLVVSIVTGLIRLFAPIVLPIIVIMFVVRVLGRRR